MILIIDSGVHIDPAAVRKAFPQEVVQNARGVADALGQCADCDVLVTMAHELTDELIARMPRLHLRDVRGYGESGYPEGT